MEKNQRKLERNVLYVFTFYSTAMFVMAQVGSWNIYIKELIVAAVILGWVIYIRRLRNHEFRAEFISAMSWVEMTLFALHTRDFSSILCVMAGVVVLTGIFCIPQIVKGGAAAATLIFIYHAFIAKTLIINSVNDFTGTILQILAIYTVSGVTWLMIHTQQETNEQLLENIHDLELAEQSKDDFMVNVSHEIRTPVNAVCGMSEVILQEDLPIDVRRDVIDIQTAGRNLLSTVSNILDFSELESGKMELAEESYNITSTITDIINMALTLDNGKNLELIVDCDANLPSNLLGDEQKLRRIIMNVLDNAIKFTKEGGIVLRLKCRKEEYGTNLVISVKDSGIGMTPEDLEKIFTSFSQVNSRRNREQGGVGLGLAITQALVRRMGGFVTVKSTPGVGSQFLFTIPQKVLDETPIVSLKNKKNIYTACYINMDKYDYSVIRDGYADCIRHFSEQLGIMFRHCKNFAELKRRIEHDNYSHVFIGWSEYCEDKNYFEQLAREITVVLILDYGKETQMGSSMLRIYKPFTILSIAAVFNGQKVVQREEQHIGLGNRFIAPKAKVLVVDDNAMNLKVMARLLLPYQIKVSMASGGREALDKLDSMDYDCVFLDHMMPEMDGVETLHKIRNKPGSYFQSLSVIAFTANAIGGAREMFLAEGFDDFIAKPIELSVLERMLRRYIPARKQIAVEEGEGNASKTAASSKAEPTAKAESVSKAEQASGAAPATGTAAKLTETQALNALNLVGINLEQGIAYCGDKEGLREIIAIYHEEGAKRKSQLENFFRENDWKNYVITVHALKSNSKGIGADQLSELAKNLEMAGKENRIDYILEHHEELIEKHDALLKAFAVNSFIYPDGYSNAAPGKAAAAQEEGAADVGQEDGAVDSSKEHSSKEHSSKEHSSKEHSSKEHSSKEHSSKEHSSLEPGSFVWELDAKALIEKMEGLKSKLESFESDGLEELLNELAKCRYNEMSLSALAEDIRGKVDDFDFLGAADALAAWETEHISD